MALSPNDCFSEPAYAPEYPASVAFVLRKTRQLRAEIGVQIDSLELSHAALAARVSTLESSSAANPITDCGSKTVAQLNGMTKVTNSVFRLLDSGTLTGGLAVVKDDTVLWNGGNWVLIGTGTRPPDVSGVGIPGKSTSFGELKNIVKDILAAMGRT